jgi:hypothetical protein
MDWIDLAHDRDEWCNVVKAVMKNSDAGNAGK